MTPASSTLVRDLPPTAGSATGRRTPPRRERRQPAAAPQAGARARAAGRSASRPAGRAGLLPFAVLVLVLLAAGLVAMLLLNTALAQGAFRLAALQKTSATLSDQQQQLQALLAREQSTDVLAAKAERLGMQDTCSPHFLVLSTGRTYGEACSASLAPAQPATGAPAASPAPSAASSPRSASPASSARTTSTGSASSAATTTTTTTTKASGSR